MTLITKIKNFFPNKNQKVLLGRWTIDYNDPRSAEKINKKIDLSNEDHCGPCGQYALEKMELQNNKTPDIFLEKQKNNK